MKEDDNNINPTDDMANNIHNQLNNPTFNGNVYLLGKESKGIDNGTYVRIKIAGNFQDFDSAKMKKFKKALSILLDIGMKEMNIDPPQEGSIILDVKLVRYVNFDARLIVKSC